MMVTLWFGQCVLSTDTDSEKFFFSFLLEIGNIYKADLIRSENRLKCVSAKQELLIHQNEAITKNLTTFPSQCESRTLNTTC